MDCDIDFILRDFKIDGDETEIVTLEGPAHSSHLSTFRIADLRSQTSCHPFQIIALNHTTRMGLMFVVGLIALRRTSRRRW